MNLVIDNLPVLEGQFFCAFTALGKTLVTNASRSANGVSCATPHTDSLPPIPPTQRTYTLFIFIFINSFFNILLIKIFEISGFEY